MIAGETPLLAGRAPVWHTAIVLLALAALSLGGFYQNGLPHLALPGLSTRAAGYLTVLVLEWLVLAFIYYSQRSRGLPLADLIAGSWPDARSVLRDLGLAVAFLVVGIPLTSFLASLLPASQGLATMLPATSLEVILWVPLALTAGFCEELIFRGFLMRQFSLLTGSTSLAIVLQGVAFGLAHGYQRWFMLVIAIYGCMFGAFATWRRSLRPGMLAHALQDTAGGLVAFFFR